MTFYGRSRRFYGGVEYFRVVSLGHPSLTPDGQYYVVNTDTVGFPPYSVDYDHPTSLQPGDLIPVATVAEAKRVMSSLPTGMYGEYHPHMAGVLVNGLEEHPSDVYERYLASTGKHPEFSCGKVGGD